MHGQVLRIEERRRNWDIHDATAMMRRSQSPQMQKLIAQIETLTNLNAPVCLIGETGSGKEVIAQWLHRERDVEPCRGRLVSLNCATLQPERAAAELFGYHGGAFTGAALKGAPGCVELANSGTLFLDELGDLPLPVQTMLLRLLDDGEYRRLQGTQTLRSNFRLISATNVELDCAVSDGTFREDLFYRLGLPPLRIPPLRERLVDLLPTARAVVERVSGGNRTLSTQAEERLMRHRWPGNFRELVAVLQRAVVLSGRSEISEDDLTIITPKERTRHSLNLQENIDKMILQAMEEAGNVQTIAAGLLGLSPRALNYQLKGVRARAARQAQ